jgi:hypothetical protein
MPLSVWPAVFADGCDIKRILPGDECTLSGTEIRFYRTVFCPATVLARIGAGQHPFHRWAEKSKISIVCFSGHVEVVKFYVNRCCKFVSNAVSRVPSPTFQKKFTRWKFGARTPVLFGLFAGEYEQEQRAKVKFGQVVNE